MNERQKNAINSFAESSERMRVRWMDRNIERDEIKIENENAKRNKDCAKRKKRMKKTQTRDELEKGTIRTHDAKPTKSSR